MYWEVITRLLVYIFLPFSCLC